MKKRKSKIASLTLSQRIDRLETLVTTLVETVDKGFKELKEDIRGINTRLDNLEIRVDRIDKRLDYNNLKELPH